MTVAGRYEDIEHTIGKDVFEKVSSSRVLMVGAGGIGCELLKNLAMCGFGDIEVVDLDTIDLSNLNRQFLFQKQHVGKAKAEVARTSALQFNPSAKIKSHHASIYEPQFDIKWFKSFDLVLNALDNLAARRHVNTMCLAANVPLVESGTEGFKGQVTLHMKKKTRCYDCDGKPSRKTYPVCTIRSTPSAPIHCIVWAKNYLFNQLFGRAEEEDAAINVEETSENAKEMEHLRKENDALNRLREAAGKPEYGRLVFEKVFTDDVKGLLLMEELWRARTPPKPLQFAEATSGIDEIRPDADALAWEQKTWSLQENTKLFLESLDALSQRLIEGRQGDSEYTLAFDKEDEPALNFVTATANLRALVYGLEQKSRFTVKEMAGNIIPAVATTNAIIAGLVVLQAINVLSGQWEACKNAWVARSIEPEALSAPNPQCPVCTTGALTLAINTSKATLRRIIEQVVQSDLGLPGDITAQEGERLLYDFDFEDNLDRPLKDLGISHSSKVVITNDYDEDESKNVLVALYIEQR
ncbi:hypothetical protein BC832DRAFT_582449 [Gaertneriomyces semiglobifer]|nr:hypothetical protein BC832DRAFT_582449 [Gaertneriomyces semiglobifer]